MSERRAIPPALPEASRTPGYVSSFDQINFRIFNGIDTKSPRPAVDEQMCWWIDGLMPVGPSELRILPGIGPVIYTAPAGLTIVWHQFGNIGASGGFPEVQGDRYYACVLLSDGSVVAVNTDTGEVRQIMAPGTILVPRTQMGFSQWGSEYLIFAKDQQNGYWLWDEHNTFTAGTFSPVITVTSGGNNYTSPPNIGFQTTGGGTGATFQAILTPGQDAVTRIVVTNPGSGFGVNDFAILNFSGGGSDDSAILQANIGVGGGVKMIIVTNGGHGYTGATRIDVTGGGGADASVVPNIQNGAIVSVTIISPGHDYTSPPTLNAVDPGGGGMPGGTGAAGYAVVGAHGVSSVTILYGGTGYFSVPDVTIIGDGHGALFRAQVTGGVVSDVQLVNPGEGYTAALAQITGGNNAAEASNWQQMLMPYGWSGTSLETYQSRVWISNGAAQEDFPPRARLIWSAPDNPADASQGSGAMVGSDSFIRTGWYWLKQSNGFLYLGGDSSINYIQNVNTTTTGATQATATTAADPGVTTTVFSNQNVDPQSGSPWPSSVQTMNRVIYFANSEGVQTSAGGAAQKISQALDGIFPASPDIYRRDADFSSAVAQVFGIQVYCLLIPHLNLMSNQIENTMLMYSHDPGQAGKFWTSAQDVQLSYIASQEIQSQMIAWGTDGRNLFRLFQNPATFRKTVRSKFWPDPGMDWTKTGVRLYGIFRDFPMDRPVDIQIENSLDHGGPFTVRLEPGQPGLQLDQISVWGPYPVGQQGRLIGLSLTTEASSGNLVALLLREQDFILEE